MELLRLSGALSAAVLTFILCLDEVAIALEPDYPCFMITQSGQVVDLSESVCGIKRTVLAVSVVSTSSEQDVEELNRTVMDYPEPEVSEEIDATQVEESSEGVDVINADE